MGKYNKNEKKDNTKNLSIYDEINEILNCDCGINDLVIYSGASSNNNFDKSDYLNDQKLNNQPIDIDKLLLSESKDHKKNKKNKKNNKNEKKNKKSFGKSKGKSLKFNSNYLLILFILVLYLKKNQYPTEKIKMFILSIIQNILNFDIKNKITNCLNYYNLYIRKN